MDDFCIIINTVPQREKKMNLLFRSLLSQGDKYKISFNFCLNISSKDKYYELINANFSNCPSSKYYLKLDDDIELVNDFFEKCIYAWESIEDTNKLTLNLLRDYRTEMWGSGNPQSYNDLVCKTGWTDGIFMFDERFLTLFKRIQLKPPPSHVKSSGVFRQISRLMRNYGGMYQVKNTLVYHGDHQSVMNADRKEKLSNK